MNILVVSLAPYDIDDDPNLRVFAVQDNEKDTIKEMLDKHYDVDFDTFQFYDATETTDAGGSFTTVEPDDDPDYEEEIKYDWIFEVQEV